MNENYFDTSILDRLIEEEYEERERERRAVLEKSIVALKNYFKDKSVEIVLLTGSIIKEGRFYPFSDIDIAVQGLREAYFKTLCEIERILGRDVDLIELERCRFSDIIRKEGVRVI